MCKQGLHINILHSIVAFSEMGLCKHFILFFSLFRDNFLQIRYNSKFMLM